MDAKTNLGYLLHHLVFILDHNSDQVLRERLGIGFSQFKIMMALKWQSGVRQRQIAEYLAQTEASVSRQIKFMQSRGIVRTKINPRSKRDHITALTPKGELLAEKAMEILNAYHAPMFTNLSEKEQERLHETLAAMHNYASNT